MTDWLGVPHKVDMQIAKYNGGRTPEDGEPDEIVTVSVWFEGDGTQVTSDERVAELEASLEQGVSNAEG